MTKRFWIGVILVALTAMAPPLARAEDDEEGLGEKLFTSDLVRVIDLSQALSPSLFTSLAGTDPLRDGGVEVRRKRQVAVKVHGASGSSVYAVLFCPFGQPQAACLTLGSLATDSDGDGDARLAFPAAGNTWAGAVLLTRDGKNQFISGFAFPPAHEAQQVGAEIELKGRIASVNTANLSFRLEGFLVDIFVGTTTKFKEVHSFAELSAGLTVEVEGFTRPDGTIFATEVKVKEDKDRD